MIKTSGLVRDLRSEPEAENEIHFPAFVKIEAEVGLDYGSLVPKLWQSLN